MSAAVILGASIILGAWIVGASAGKAIDRMTARLDIINTHGLHLRNYPDGRKSGFVVKVLPDDQ
jgi:hypothetical protein